MNFYCQLDYRHVPYPSPTSPNGNIADNGCGVCSASMVVEYLTGRDFPPEEAAKLAKASGAREGFGTSMAPYAPAICEKFDLVFRTTTDPAEVKAFLEKKEGVVIANTLGDREGWIGVFSDSRHYVVLVSVEADTVAVWDPMLNPGRYDIPGRIGKVRLDGYTAYADFSVIENDCLGNTYFLFSRKREF